MSIKEKIKAVQNYIDKRYSKADLEIIDQLSKETQHRFNPKAGSCGCNDKQMYHVRVYWGLVAENKEFMYCADCIKSDATHGMLVEIL